MKLRQTGSLDLQAFLSQFTALILVTAERLGSFAINDVLDGSHFLVHKD